MGNSENAIQIFLFENKERVERICQMNQKKKFIDSRSRNSFNKNNNGAFFYF